MGLATSEVFENKTRPNGNGGEVSESASLSKKKRRSLSIWIQAVDKNLAENITITKSTAGLILLAFGLLQVILNYGGSAMSWARNDQTTVEHVQAVQKTQEDFEKKVDSRFLDTRDGIKELKDEMKKMNEGYQEMREFKIKVETANQILKDVK